MGLVETVMYMWGISIVLGCVYVIVRMIQGDTSLGGFM